MTTIKKIIFILAIGLLFFSSNVFAKTYKVHISWQTNNFSLPNYQAKNLSNSGSRIKLIAVVFDEKGKLLNPKKLKFFWKVNGSRSFFNYLEKAHPDSAYGNNKIIIADTRISKAKQLKVELLVEDYYNNKGEDEVVVPFEEPDVLVCLNRGEVLKKEIFVKDKDVLSPKLIFFNKNEVDQLSYRWIANNRVIFEQKELVIDKNIVLPTAIRLIVLGNKKRVVATSKKIYLYSLNKK